MTDDVDVASLSDQEKRAVRRRRKWEGRLGHLGTVLQAVGALLLAVAAFVPPDLGKLPSWLAPAPIAGSELGKVPSWLVPALVVGGVVLSVWGLLDTVTRSPRYARLIQEHREAQQRAQQRSASLVAILDLALRALMDDLDVDFSNARISVYRHKGSSFILLDRVSGVQRFEQVGRDTYPDSEGVIGVVWDSGGTVVTGLPEDRAAWEAKCVADYRIPQGTARHFSMQSRSFVGQRIDLSRGVHVGLILLESEAPRGVNGTTLDKMRESPNFGLLSQIFEVVVRLLDEQDVNHFRSTRSVGS